MNVIFHRRAFIAKVEKYLTGRGANQINKDLTITEIIAIMYIY